jgi:hypothetical protein
MARLPASSFAKGVAATAGYAAFWAALIALPVESARVARLELAPAHRPGAVAFARASVAHHVYAVVDQRAQVLSPAQRTGVARAILEEAARATMDPLLVLAVIQVESAFDPHAASGAGAVGLMQLLHPTMRQELERSRLPSADPLDPVANVRAGVRYLDRLLGIFDDLELALMAYNAGPNRIRRYLREGGIPERFLGYPRSVVRALRRHSAAADALARATAAAPTQLWAGHAVTGAAELAGAVASARDAVAPSDVRVAAPALVALAGAARTGTGWRVPARGGGPGPRGDGALDRDRAAEEGLRDDGLGAEWLGEDEDGPRSGPPSS